MRDVGLYLIGGIGGLVLGAMLNDFGRTLVRVIFGWLAYIGIITLVGRLPIVWQVLAVLVAVLVDLIRRTGGSKDGENHISLAHNRMPATLAGPIHPWQTHDGSVITRGVPLLTKEV